MGKCGQQLLYWMVQGQTLLLMSQKIVVLQTLNAMDNPHLNYSFRRILNTNVSSHNIFSTLGMPLTHSCNFREESTLLGQSIWKGLWNEVGAYKYQGINSSGGSEVWRDKSQVRTQALCSSYWSEKKKKKKTEPEKIVYMFCDEYITECDNTLKTWDLNHWLQELVWYNLTWQSRPQWPFYQGSDLFLLFPSPLERPKDL